MTKLKISESTRAFFRNEEKRKKAFLILLAGVTVIVTGLVSVFVAVVVRNGDILGNTPIQEVEAKEDRDTRPREERNDYRESRISAKDGGELDVGEIKLVFPPGFSDEDVIVSYRAVRTDKLSASHQIGPMYDLGAKKVSGKAVANFNKPIKIITKVADGDVESFDLTKIATYFYSDANERWEKLEGSLNKTKDNIVAYTDHFTVFTSAGDDPNGSVQGESDEQTELGALVGSVLGTTNSGSSDSSPSSSNGENSTNNSQPSEAVIVDNSDPAPYFIPGGQTEPAQPSWWGVIYSGYNGTALFTGNSINTTPHNWATWSAEGINGELELFASIPSGPFIYDYPDGYYGTVMPLTHGATYVITHAGGQTSVTVDQAANAGGAASLGTYEFNGSGSVYLTDVVPESGASLLSAIVFDAISFGGEFDPNMDITPPTIEDVKTSAYEGFLIIEAKITDEGSGVAEAYVYFNGQMYPMQANGDIYSVAIPYSRGVNFDYYILAYDNAGNEAIWNPTKGYVTRGMFGRYLGIAPWDIYSGKIGERCIADPYCPGYETIIGEPINTVNGNLVDTIDIVQVGGRPEIDLKISYNGQGGGLTIFGENWTHSYNYHVLEMDNAEFVGAFVYYPDGRVVRFSGPEFEPDPGNFEKLTKTGGGYELLFKDLTKVIFNSEGVVTRIEDANGNGLDFAYAEIVKYTPYAQITSIKADGGREITFDYSGEGFVSQVNAPEGKMIKFEYNDSDDLVKITDGNGGETKFEYDDHNMIGKISPKGYSYTANTFDGERRVTKQVAGASFEQNFTYDADQTVVTDISSNSVTYNYNEDKVVTSMVNAQGKPITYEYNQEKQRTAMIDRDDNRYEYDYDENGNMIYEKDPLQYEVNRTFNTTFNKPTSEVYKQSDHTTSGEYDGKGNLTKIIDADSSESTFTYDSYGQLVESTDFNVNPTEYTYTSEGDLETVTDAESNVEQFGYDGLGRLLEYVNARGFSYAYAYDKNDNLLEVSGPLGYTLSYTYDPNDNLETETDANGGVTKFTFDQSENLTEVRNQLDFLTSLTYGSMNELLSQTDAEGRITNYGYDSIYSLIQTTQAAGTSDEAITKVEYNEMKYPVQVTDPEGRIAQYEYDPLQRVKKEIKNVTASTPDSENNVTTEYEYSATGMMIKLKDANENVTTYTFDALDRLIREEDAEAQVTEYEYDAQSNLIKVTNPRSFETRYEYDSLNRLERIIDAKDGITTFEYDENDNLVLSIDANGVKTRYVYNELDRLSEKIENYVGGGPVDPGSGSGTSSRTNVSTKYEYDLHGNLSKIINPRGYPTVFTYDPAHRNTIVTDALTNTVNFTYDKVDNLLQINDRNSNNQDYIYDNLDRVVKYTNQEGHFETYAYDKVGNELTFVNARGKTFSKQYDPLNRIKVATDPYSKTQVSVYDPMGNLLSFTDENGHTDNFEYDKVYRLRRAIDAEEYVTEYQYDENGNVVKTIDGNGNPTHYIYDELDRLTNTINAENEEKKFGYDALTNITLETEADETQHKYVYDHLYRLVSVTNNFKPGGPSNSDTNVITYYSYDANGNMVDTTNPLGNLTSFEYDPLDRLIKETNPLSNEWTYGYDGEGNLTSRLDANGDTTDYVYYPDNVLKKIQYPTYAVDYLYSKTNYATQMTDNLGVTSWSYDDLDRMITQNDPFNRGISYEYDFVGNLTKLAYPDASTHSTNSGQAGSAQGTRYVTHQYLKNDWLQESTSIDNDKVTFTRDGVGNPTRLDRSNSTFTDMVYDKVYRPLMVHSNQVGHGDHLVDKYSYTYNKVGHITQEVAEYGWRHPSTGSGQGPNVVTTNYGYDGLHRLVNASDDDENSTQYTYDAAGNRTTLIERIKNKGPETRHYSYNPANQLLQINIDSPMPPNVVTYEYEYDANGNRIDKLIKDETGVDRGTRYSYDFENRLTQAQDYQGQIVKKNKKGPGNYVVNDKAKTDLEYDGNGRRLTKTYYSGASQTGKRSEYVFDRLDPIVEYSMWNHQRNNMYRDSEQNLMFFQEFKSEQAPNGTIYFYHYDGEGNISATTKHQGQSDHAYRFDEYGGVMPEVGNDKNRNNGPAWLAPHNEYTLTQKQYDSNMDLYYFGARHYDSLTGTWMTQDTYRGEIENPASLHRYMYNYDSPVNYRDEYGFEGKSYPQAGPAPMSVPTPTPTPTSDAEPTAPSVAEVSTTQIDCSIMSSEHCATYYYRPTVGYNDIGHAALRLDTGTYVSFGTKGPYTLWEVLVVGEEGEYRTAESGKDKLERFESIRVYIPNPSGVQKWFEETVGDLYKQKPSTYHLLLNNCVDQVQAALEAGGVSTFGETPQEVAYSLNNPELNELNLKLQMMQSVDRDIWIFYGY